MEELEALLILNSLPLIGSIKIRLLIQQFGSSIDALKAPLNDIAILPGFGPKILDAWKQGLKEEKWLEDLSLIKKFGVTVIPYFSPQYPKKLLEIVDFPLILYVQGKLLRQDERSLAVVGTRQATIYGQEMSKQFSKGLAQAGFTIVSGLARGIDTLAHQGALEAGRTIAVLGSGLASIYPSENKNLAAQIAECGAVISEFPMATSPDRSHFPQRNRIVSGMTLGTILIEAPEKSGAMLTAEKAMTQGRPVFALPGRADSDYFRGNHSLIKSKKAELVENIQDILHYFNPTSLPFTVKTSATQKIPLEKEEELLLSQFPTEELPLEEMISRFQWPVAKLNVLLMSLVLKKMIKEYPGKIYKKI